MDHTHVADNGSPDLAAFLATFDTLSTEDKTKALQHIISQRRGETSKSHIASTQSGSLASTVQHAHSCHICRQLVLTHKLRDDGKTRLESNDVTLTKETLQQGVAQKCILVEWLFALLARGLLDLKTDIAKTISLPSHLETIRDITDDLQYLSPKGIALDCYGSTSDEEDEIVVRLEFEIDAVLIDQMWTVIVVFEIPVATWFWLAWPPPEHQLLPKLYRD
jgi:hypothetical protein